MIKTNVMEDDGKRVMVKKMTKGGGITIPVAFRKEFGLEHKDQFTIEVDKHTGDITLRRIAGKCIFTGTTDNLMQVNGRYVSMAALGEIHEQLMETGYIQDVLETNLNGNMTLKKVNSVDREKVKSLKKQIETNREELKAVGDDIDMGYTQTTDIETQPTEMNPDVEVKKASKGKVTDINQKNKQKSKKLVQATQPTFLEESAATEDEEKTITNDKEETVEKSVEKEETSNKSRKSRRGTRR